MKTLSNEFLAQVDAMVEHIKADYAAWNKPDPTDPIKVAVRTKMVEHFNNSIKVIPGSKYIKIASNGGVHSFIVVKPDAKFKLGDILKAASWAAPARNFPRGNVVTGDFKTVSWTGA